MSYSLNTPVGFFIFNRPDCTRRVFEKIREAKPPMLLLVADGPRDDRPEDAALCKKCRDIATNVDWPCDLRVKFAEKNLGCGPNVSQGYDWIFSQVEEAIFLEDDTLPDISFFRYCEELLEKYRYDTRIGLISGDNFEFSGISNAYSYSYSRIAHIWGWASWRRVWDLYDYDMKVWPQLREENFLSKLFMDRLYVDAMNNVFDELYEAKKKHTWDYQLQLTVWANDLLCVIPDRNLVSNIGVEGVHYSRARVYPDNPHSLINRPIKCMDFPVKHNEEIENNEMLEAKSRLLVLGCWNNWDRKKYVLKRFIKKCLNIK